MSGEWVPVLVVLALGVVVGLWVASRLRRETGPDAGEADAELRLSDLRQRREELYAQLRWTTDQNDRRALEDAAARVLRDLDRLQAESPAAAEEKRTAEAAESADPAVAEHGEAKAVDATTADTRAGRAMVAGFLGGAAMVALVAVLVFWAMSDSKPAAEMEGGATPMQGEEHPEAALPPEVAARLGALRQEVAENPNDLVARKQLALGLLSAEQYFEAFEVAQGILAGRPDDPDGLYVSGMVRMTMGQDDEAMAALNRVLEQYPNHILALAGRGMIFMRQGDREAAILVWERALEAAGGSHPDLEALLAMARNAPEEPIAGGQVAPSRPTPGSLAAGAGSPVPAPAVEPPSAPAAVPSDSFSVRVELGESVSVPRGATLFVFLRQAEQGPPSAVKRIQNPRFPLETVLGPADSMLGRDLPSTGLISARLDADGSASSRDAGDLAVQQSARVGDRVVLVLDR